MEKLKLHLEQLNHVPFYFVRHGQTDWNKENKVSVSFKKYSVENLLKNYLIAKVLKALKRDKFTKWDIYKK